MDKQSKEKALAVLCATLITCASIPVAAIASNKPYKNETAAGINCSLGSQQSNETAEDKTEQGSGTRTILIEGDDTLYSDSSCEHGTSSSDNGKPSADIMKKSSGTNKHGVFFSLKNGKIVEKENSIRCWKEHKGTLYIDFKGKLTQGKLDQDGLHFVDKHGNRIAPSNIANKVIIGKNVTSIGTSAFEGWDISTVSFEKGSRCSSIGSNAFRDCYLMKKVSIPQSIEKICSYAFRNCHAKLKVSYESPAKTSVAATAYKKDTTKTSAMAKRCLKVKTKALGKRAIEVSWNKVTGARRYVVFYKKDTGGSFAKKQISAKNGKEQRVTLKKLKKGSQYAAYVVAYKSKKATSASAIVRSATVKTAKVK